MAAGCSHRPGTTWNNLPVELKQTILDSLIDSFQTIESPFTWSAARRMSELSQNLLSLSRVSPDFAERDLEPALQAYIRRAMFEQQQILSANGISAVKEQRLGAAMPEGIDGSADAVKPTSLAWTRRLTEINSVLGPIREYTALEHCNDGRVWAYKR